MHDDGDGIRYFHGFAFDLTLLHSGVTRNQEELCVVLICTSFLFHSIVFVPGIFACDPVLAVFMVQGASK